MVTIEEAKQQVAEREKELVSARRAIPETSTRKLRKVPRVERRKYLKQVEATKEQIRGAEKQVGEYKEEIKKVEEEKKAYEAEQRAKEEELSRIRKGLPVKTGYIIVKLNTGETIPVPTKEIKEFKKSLPKGTYIRQSMTYGAKFEGKRGVPFGYKEIISRKTGKSYLVPKENALIPILDIKGRLIGYQKQIKEIVDGKTFRKLEPTGIISEQEFKNIWGDKPLVLKRKLSDFEIMVEEQKRMQREKGSSPLIMTTPEYVPPIPIGKIEFPEPTKFQELLLKGYGYYEKAEEKAQQYVTEPIAKGFGTIGITKERYISGLYQIMPPYRATEELIKLKYPKEARLFKRYVTSSGIGMIKGIKEQPIKTGVVFGIAVASPIIISKLGAVTSSLGLGGKIVSTVGKVSPKVAKTLPIVSRAVFKATPYFLGGLYVGRQAREISKLKTPEERGEKVGRIVSTEVVPFVLGSQIGARYVVRSEMKKALIEEVPKEKRAEFKEYLKKIEKLNLKPEQIKNLDLNKIKRIDPKLHDKLRKFLIRYGNDVYIGGSGAQSTQLKKIPRAPKDLDLYVESNTRGWAKQIYNQVFKTSGVEGYVLKGDKIYLGSNKVIEIHTVSEMLQPNIEQVVPWWRSWKSGITKTPEGMSVMKLEVQAVRKLQGFFKGEGSLTIKNPRFKDWIDFKQIYEEAVLRETTKVESSIFLRGLKRMELKKFFPSGKKGQFFPTFPELKPAPKGEFWLIGKGHIPPQRLLQVSFEPIRPYAIIFPSKPKLYPLYKPKPTQKRYTPIFPSKPTKYPLGLKPTPPYAPPVKRTPFTTPPYTPTTPTTPPVYPPITPPTYPPYTPPTKITPPYTPPPEILKPQEKKKKYPQPLMKWVKTYRVYLKRYGKWKLLGGGKGLPKAKAIKLGERKARLTLAASFKIRPTKQLVPMKLIDYRESYVPSPKVFRAYKIRKGRRIPLEEEWIQRAKYRLSMRPEVREIQLARRRKTKKLKSIFNLKTRGGFKLW